MAASTAYSTNDLSRLPNISFSFVEGFISQRSGSSGKEQMNKGFKYYSEGYVHAVKLFPDDAGCNIKARCYRSQRKNETPHVIEVFISKGDKEPRVEQSQCSCTIGQSGSCGHVTALLYQLGFYKQMKMSSIPTDVAKTSLPQTWHIPRGDKMRGSKLDNIVVQGYDRNDPHRATKGLRTTLYNPITASCIDKEVGQLLDKIKDMSIIISTVVDSGDSPAVEKVQTRFGQFPKGSILSYQQKIACEYVLNVMDGVVFPDLPVRNCMVNNFHCVLSEKQLKTFESLTVTISESHEIAACTKTQSLDPKWHRLRKDRITASKAGEVAKRRKDSEKLAERLQTGRHHTSSAMKYGIDSEGTAALAYSKKMDNVVNLYPCGIIISPYSHWLAASPDRLVYNPSRDEPYGLLEIKCTQKSLADLQYLTEKDGELVLKEGDNYYHQVQMQLAVTGLPWCDFFVWSTEATHMETIKFNEQFWQNTKDKLDVFYFTHYCK